jgi:hypothetical protein
MNTAESGNAGIVRVAGRDLLASAADLAACRRAIRAGSKTFHAASLLLPRRIRGSALALYAFCREADDAIDGSAQPLQALAALQMRLDLAYAGVPLDNAADRALAAVVAPCLRVLLGTPPGAVTRRSRTSGPTACGSPGRSA